jgi:diketogulonate reductase-like aldo/keto reductase
MKINNLLLRNNYSIPIIGIGTVKVNNLNEIIPAAINNGYSLIDTAINYKNEEEIGKALQGKREKVFIVSKIQISTNGYNETLKAVEGSLKRLKTTYIDLMLIHQPFGDVYGEWRALEKLYNEGVLKSIGVSNFDVPKLMDLLIHSSIQPMVNQIELHPYFQQKELVEFCKQEDIIIQAWSPLGQGKINFNKDKILCDIAQKYNKSVYEIILRWDIQNNIIPLPRTTSIEHLKSNIDISNFELSEEDIDNIKKLDQNHTFYQDHRNPDVVKLLSVLVNNNDDKTKLNISADYYDYVYDKKK